MKHKRQRSAVLALFSLAMLAFVSAQISSPRAVGNADTTRAALVIGNSAYKASPLANPVNDATDIAASLRSAGFEVILRTDADLAGMEDALADFQKLLKGKDTALLYYAGHGVQVDGENYLIPVKEVIESSAHVKTRSVALGDYLSGSGIRG